MSQKCLPVNVSDIILSHFNGLLSVTRHRLLSLGKHEYVHPISRKQSNIKTVLLRILFLRHHQVRFQSENAHVYPLLTRVIRCQIIKGTSVFFIRLFGFATFTATLKLVSRVGLP